MKSGAAPGTLRRPALVLFDLDGTLVDTAPDLAAAANACRAERGLPPLPLGALRPWASHGARGLLHAALQLAPGDPDYEPMRLRFLAVYEQALCVHSRLFAPLPLMLDDLDGAGIRWGIVTNKAARYTEPLVRALRLDGRAAVVVSGDTTPRPKPDPAPVLHAMAVGRATGAQTLFIGDDRRDVAAGRAAGVQTAAAAYGYLADDADVMSWAADHVFRSPQELREWTETLSTGTPPRATGDPRGDPPA